MTSLRSDAGARRRWPMTTPEDSIIAGERARQLIESDEYIKAWRTLHDAAMERLLTCDAGDDEARFIAWTEVRVMQMLNGAMDSLIKQGEQAASVLEKMQERRLKLMRGRK